LKIALLDLEFNTTCFYIQQKSIVESITFNNRTFYTKFKKYTLPLSSTLRQQHCNHQITLAVPLIENNTIDYIVVEYQQDDWRAFYSLLKHLLKSLNIENFNAYTNRQTERFQLFIPREQITLELAYKEVENIKHLLEIKSNKSYKIYPNIHLPKKLNIITLPTEKT